MGGGRNCEMGDLAGRIGAGGGMVGGVEGYRRLPRIAPLVFFITTLHSSKTKNGLDSDLYLAVLSPLSSKALVARRMLFSPPFQNSRSSTSYLLANIPNFRKYTGVSIYVFDFLCSSPKRAVKLLMSLVLLSPPKYRTR
jgi:hypothetical protein